MISTIYMSVVWPTVLLLLSILYAGVRYLAMHRKAKSGQNVFIYIDNQRYDAKIVDKKGDYLVQVDEIYPGYTQWVGPFDIYF